MVSYALLIHAHARLSLEEDTVIPRILVQKGLRILFGLRAGPVQLCNRRTGETWEDLLDRKEIVHIEGIVFEGQSRSTSLRNPILWFFFPPLKSRSSSEQTTNSNHCLYL